MYWKENTQLKYFWVSIREHIYRQIGSWETYAEIKKQESTYTGKQVVEKPMQKLKAKNTFAGK